MSQAIVDPAELRRFATNLKRFNADLQSALAGLHGQLIGLGDSWRDQEHDRFRQEFEATMQVLERFLEVSEEHIPFLLRKAERIEEYLSQTMSHAKPTFARSTRFATGTRRWPTTPTASPRRWPASSWRFAAPSTGSTSSTPSGSRPSATARRRWCGRRPSCRSGSSRPGTAASPTARCRRRPSGRAKARLEHAEEQVEQVRQWIGRLPKVIDEVYRGAARRLQNFLEDDLPKGQTDLARRHRVAGSRTPACGPTSPRGASSGRRL